MTGQQEEEEEELSQQKEDLEIARKIENMNKEGKGEEF